MQKNDAVNMTHGSIIRLIMGFMLPTFLGNIFQQFYNIADSIIAGQFLGIEALAAVGSTGSLMFFVTGWVSGLCSGFGVLLSQSFGAGDYKRMHHYAAMSIILAVLNGIIFSVLLLFGNIGILHFMNYSNDMIPLVSGYMKIIYFGILITSAYNLASAFLRALGDSRTPLYFLVFSAVLNVLLDIVFILKWNMGVEGCAFATIIAQGVSALLCLGYIIRKYPVLHLSKQDFCISLKSFYQLLVIGVPMGLQFSITAVGTIVVQTAVNGYGEIYMAGFSTAGKIQNLLNTVYVAFGTTLATFVGQNLGANKLNRIKAGVKTVQIMSVVWSIITMVVMFWGAKYFVYFFVSPSEVETVEVAVHYFRTVLWFYPLLGSIFIYRNVLQGMGYGMVPFLGGVFELAARGTVASFVGSASFTGICLADPIAWGAALVALIPYYFYRIRRV